jgi:hypothetical protein
MDGSLANSRLARRAWIGAAAVLAVAGCWGRDQPTAPPSAPGLHTLRGHVVLVGQTVGADGRFAGTRVVGDADGVVVELWGGSTLLARTTTTRGVYAFPNLPAGGYRVRTGVTPVLRDVSLPLTVTDTDLEARDTLRLESAGQLYPVPNPFSTETIVYFTLPDTERVHLAILGLAGDTIKTLLVARRPPGDNQVRWDGTDKNSQPSGARLVWVTFSTSADSGLADVLRDLRAQLLFHEPTPLP